MSVAELRAMAEQYRAVGRQTDMFDGESAEAEPERADAPGSIPEEVLEKVRREAREESAAESAALRAELEAEKARRRDEVEAAVKRRLKKESAEAAARAAEEARSRAEEEAAEKYGAELDELRRAAAEASEISEGLRERLKNADGQYATLKVYFAAIRENFVRAAELIGTFDGGDREKYTAAFVKLLDALREEITEK